MTETKFTPGPWIVGPFDMIWPASDVEYADGKWREKVHEPRIIASASKGNLLPDEDRANALLMASAPDLYETLAKFMDFKDSDYVPNNLFERARSVLAKARGVFHPSGGDRHGE